MNKTLLDYFKNLYSALIGNASKDQSFECLYLIQEPLVNYPHDCA